MTLSVPWLDRLAHDLRGPLMPLQTAAYLLKSGQVDAAQQQELFALIERQTRLMGSMIEELSDWSRAARGQLLGHMAPCDISMLLETASGAVAPFDGSAVSIRDETDGVDVIGDQIRLVEALTSLMGYAAACSGDTAPELRARTLDEVVHLDLAVGPPATSAGELATLFENPLPEPHDGGLGLKLLIARAIVVAHAGSLAAQPMATGGFRIHCELPAAPIGAM